MATRNLTFKSTNLGENVTLMLCFTPPVPNLYVDQFPIAWKVTTLAARGRSSLNATWTSTLGFSATQVGEGSLVTAGNYTPIKAGQTTNLLLDQSVQPPVQYWSDPKDRKGVTTVQAVNRTGGHAGIGLGFVTNVNTPIEAMNVALTWPNVGNTLAVVGDFTPVLSAYIAMGYQETQIIRGDIQSVDPIWQQNLISLRPNTTIVISKDATGAYIATQLLSPSMAIEMNDVSTSAAVDSVPLWKTVDEDLASSFKRSYSAVLTFEASIWGNSIAHCIEPIVKRLAARGYGIRVISKPKQSDVGIQLILPLNASCAQAEEEINKATQIIGYPGRMAIKERSGAKQSHFGGSVNYWLDISPASYGWHDRNKIVPGNDEDTLPEPEGTPIGHGATIGGNTLPGGAAGGNGTASSYAGSSVGDDDDDDDDDDEGAQTPAQVSYGITRVVRKVPSSVSFR